MGYWDKDKHQATDAQLALRRQTEIQYEATLVNFLLTAGGLAKHRKDLLEMRRRCEGVERLTVADFNERFQEFPILLQVNRLNGVKLHACEKAFLPALFHKFCRAPFVEAYEDFCDASFPRANGRTLGMVFPRKGFVRGMIIHNGGLDAYRKPDMVVMHHTDEATDGSIVDTYLQSFKPLVEAIAATGWRWD